MAATASRWGQRVVCMAALQNDWAFYSGDVSQAFFQGMSFDEVHTSARARAHWCSKLVM